MVAVYGADENCMTFNPCSGSLVYNMRYIAAVAGILVTLLGN